MDNKTGGQEQDPMDRNVFDRALKRESKRAFILIMALMFCAMLTSFVVFWLTVPEPIPARSAGADVVADTATPTATPHESMAPEATGTPSEPTPVPPVNTHTPAPNTPAPSLPVVSPSPSGGGSSSDGGGAIETPAPTVVPTASPEATVTPGPTVSPTPAPTPSATPLPTPMPVPSVSPSPTPSATPVITPAPQDGELLIVGSVVVNGPTPTPTPVPTASPTPSPTPTPFEGTLTFSGHGTQYSEIFDMPISQGVITITITGVRGGFGVYIHPVVDGVPVLDHTHVAFYNEVLSPGTISSWFYSIPVGPSVLDVHATDAMWWTICISAE